MSDLKNGVSDVQSESQRSITQRSRAMATPKKVPHAVADQILTHLLENDLQVGDWLPSESQWMRMTGASRSSVREALQLLVGMGLMEARSGRGYVLVRSLSATESPAALSEEELQEFTEARLILECECAALAALRATPEDFARLENLLESIGQKVNSVTSVYQETIEFHLELAKVARNRVLYEMLSSIMPKLAAVGEQLAQEIPIRAPLDLEIHRALLDEIRSGDPDRARIAMAEHIQHATHQYGLPFHRSSKRLFHKDQRSKENPPRRG